jgi:pSer/pThr/pTyr-binding forkhead associated (FHA) protein
MSEGSDISRQFPLVSDTAPKVQLSVLRGPGEGATIRLRRVLTLIGSREGCKISLNHRGVAPVHCAIVNTGAVVFARDLVTETKTYLNDLPLECEKLDDGDVLKIAQWELAVHIQRRSLGDSADDASLLDLEPSQAVALQVADNGQLTKLRREVCVIGRKIGSDLLVQHQRVSRAHALIATYMGQPTVFDLLSSNGIQVNDQPAICAPIHSGDRLEIGDAVLRVVIPGQVAQPVIVQEDADVDTTVIRLDDEEDQLDIRAAEIDPGSPS